MNQVAHDPSGLKLCNSASLRILSSGTQICLHLVGKFIRKKGIFKEKFSAVEFLFVS